VTRSKTNAILLATLGIVAACADPLGVDDVITGKPVMPDELRQPTFIDVGAPISAMASHDFEVFVGISSVVERVGDTTLEAVDVVVGDSGPFTTGVVQAMTRRADGSVLIVGDNGLFYGKGQRLEYSDASVALAGLTVRSLDAVGPIDSERIWVGATQGLYQLESGTLERWTVGDGGAVTAVREVGAKVLVARGASLYEVDRSGQDEEPVELNSGTIHDIIRGASGSAYLATDRGLVVRASDGRYTRYTLSGDDRGVPVSSISFDSLTGVYALVPDGVVRVPSPGAAAEGVAPIVSGATLTVDFFGDAWGADDATLTGALVVPALSYFDDGVQDLMVARCSGCHGETDRPLGAPYIPFERAPDEVDPSDVPYFEQLTSFRDLIQARINDAADPMPPAPGQALEADDYQLIMRWIATGTAR